MDSEIQNVKILHAQNQANLVQFLREDLDLTETIITAAKIGSPEHAEKGRAHARKALLTIRQLCGRVEDSKTCDEIQSRADTLEAALKKLEADPQRNAQNLLDAQIEPLPVSKKT